MTDIVKQPKQQTDAAVSPSSMSNHEWMMHTNAKYVQTFASTVGSLPIIPARHMTIITCMDARIDCGKAMGIAEGDCHIIRNAGGRIKDALRSLIISQEMMGTKEVAIIHHTNCGACTLNEQSLKQRLASRPHQPSDASEIDFMSFNNADVFQNLRNELKIYREYQTLLQGIIVNGYVFDVKTGELHHVVEEEEQQQQNIPITVTAAAETVTTTPSSSDDDINEQDKENIAELGTSPAQPILAGGIAGSFQRLVKIISSNSF